MQNERKHKIDNMLTETEKKIRSGELNLVSLEEFKANSIERMKEIRKKSQAHKVMSEISRYLKSHNIYFEEYGKEDIPNITIEFKICDRCPGRFT